MQHTHEHALRPRRLSFENLASSVGYTVEEDTYCFSDVSRFKHIQSTGNYELFQLNGMKKAISIHY